MAVLSSLRDDSHWLNHYPALRWRRIAKSFGKEVSTESPVTVKEVDLKKNETKQDTQESKSQLHDTANNVITKVNSVFHG